MLAWWLRKRGVFTILVETFGGLEALTLRVCREAQELKFVYPISTSVPLIQDSI